MSKQIFGVASSVSQGAALVCLFDNVCHPTHDNARPNRVCIHNPYGGGSILASNFTPWPQPCSAVAQLPARAPTPGPSAAPLAPHGQFRKPGFAKSCRWGDFANRGFAHLCRRDDSANRGTKGRVGLLSPDSAGFLDSGRITQLCGGFPIWVAPQASCWSMS